MKPILAETYDSSDDIRGWLLSEKLDGIRAIWTGSAMLSRNGKPLSAPASFLSSLPAGIPLDGELTAGRGTFQTMLSAVRLPDHPAWSAIRYHVFDAPETPGGFESRLAFAASAISTSPVAIIVPHVPVDGRHHMIRLASALLREGAEGVMLRRPGSPYIRGRCRHLLKHKPRPDDEALVTGHAPNVILCQWRGLLIRIGAGLTNALRSSLPPVGSIVTFTYSGLTSSGLPFQPVFQAIRNYE